MKPSVFVSASAVGYYGDRGDEELTESGKAMGQMLGVKVALQKILGGYDIVPVRAA
jgi:NAD dependent epimerase/dehydratase family enzyme